MLQDKLISFALGGEEWVLWLLIALSVLCVGIAIERMIFSAVNRTAQSGLEPVLTSPWICRVAWA